MGTKLVGLLLSSLIEMEAYYLPLIEPVYLAPPSSHPSGEFKREGAKLLQGSLCSALSVRASNYPRTAFIVWLRERETHHSLAYGFPYSS